MGDYDPYDDLSENRPHVEEWSARESAGSILFAYAVGGLMVAVLVYTALRQVTG